MLRRHFIKNTSGSGSIYAFYYESRYNSNVDLLRDDKITNLDPSTSDVYNYWTYLGSYYNTTTGIGIWKIKAPSIQNFGDLLNKNGYSISLPSSITTLILPEGIENYNSDLCEHSDYLQQVTFPSTLKTIGRRAFYNCDKLKQVVFNENLEKIGELAFSSCDALTNIIFPNTLTTIGDSAFGASPKLTTITIPDNVTYIGSYAFDNCTSLTTVNSNCGACFIGRDAFDGTPWLKQQSGLITLGSNIVQAKDYFTDAEIIIPEWVEGIAYDACVGSTSATKLVLPNSVKIIGGESFILGDNPVIEYTGTIDEWCNIKWYDTPHDWVRGTWVQPYIQGSLVTDVIFPSNLTTVGSCTFYNWNNLKSVTLHDNITCIESNAFDRCNIPSLLLPDSIEIIESGAIDTNIAIENIPLNLKSACVGYDLFGNSDSGIMFTNTVLNIPKTLVRMEPSSIITPNVDTIIVDSENPVYDSRDNCNAIIKTNTNTLFKGCKNTIIPLSIDTIGTDAFNYSSDVVSIVIPKNITNFYTHCFGKSLKDLYYNGSLTEYCNISKSYPFQTHYNLHVQNEDVKNLIIPSDINTIKHDAFAYCNIETLVVPANITKIGECAFENCPLLSEITLPESVQQISSTAFSKCKLTKNNIHNFSSLDAESNSYWGATIYQYESNGLLGNDNVLYVCRPNVNDLYVSSYFNNIQSYYLQKDFNTIQVEEGNTVYDSRENCNAIIETATNKLILGCSKTTIPTSVINIESNSFTYTEMYKNNTLWEDGVLYLDNCLLGINSKDVPNKSVNIKDGTRITAQITPNVDSITIPSSIEHFNIQLPNVSQKIYDINYLGTIEQWNNLLLQQSFIQRPKNLYINGEKVVNLVIPDTITTVSSNFGYLESPITATINAAHVKNKCWHCTNLKELTVGENVQTFDLNFYDSPIEILYWNANRAPSSEAVTYYKSTLQEVYLNGNFTRLNNTFTNSSNLSQIKISSPLDRITDDAFKKCIQLSSVELPNTLTYIGDYVFQDCTNLNELIIPESVQFIGYNAFNNSGIYNTESNWINDGLYINNCLVAIKDSVSDFIIHPDTRLLAESVLRQDTITSIHIPSSVLYISGGNISENLSIITVDENNPNFDSRDNCNAIIETATNTLLKGCNTTIIPQTIEKLYKECFKNAKALQTITIPESVKTIGYGAFWWCSALEEVSILGDNITLHALWPDTTSAALCNGVFQGCKDLKMISLPQHITLGAGCFAFCESLTTINYNGTIAEWESIDKPKFWNEGVPTSCKIYCTDGTINISA